MLGGTTVGAWRAQQMEGRSGKILGVLDGSGMGAHFPVSRMCVLLEARCSVTADHEISIYRVLAK